MLELQTFLYSYYDGLTLTAPGGLDIDHMVPLAEAWDLK